MHPETSTQSSPNQNNKVSLATLPHSLTAPSITLALAIFLFLFLLILPMHAGDELYGADVWRHYFYTRFGEAQEFFGKTVALQSEPVADTYPTSLRSNMYLLSTLLGDDPYLLIFAD